MSNIWDSIEAQMRRELLGPSPDSTAAVPIEPLTEHEAVEAAAVFHALLKRGDPYALTRTIEHVLRMRASPRRGPV
jgi:hypothetical protein